MLLEHRNIIRRRIRELSLSLTATEYKIATYGDSTGPDVQALDTATGTDRTALPHEPR